MRSRSLMLVVVVILAVGVVAGVLGERLVRARQSPEARAEQSVRTGELAEAEIAYFELLERGPVTVPLLVAFLDNHAGVVAPRPDDPDALGTRIAAEHPAAIPDDRIEALLARPDLPPDVLLLGTFWYGVVSGHAASSPELRRAVAQAARQDPPMPWANHLLARDAERRGARTEAAEAYAREGLVFARADDLNLALDLWIRDGAWTKVERALADPRAGDRVDPDVRFREAVHRRAWLAAARWFVPSVHPDVELGTGLLALLSALAWGAFCARLGRLAERPRLRLPLYTTAFVLGVCSVYLTMLLIAFEEAVLHLEPTGNAAADLVYYTFGVGLREEVSKLVFFAPLLPFVRRFGTKLDVLVCGALVGLGFGAEENLSYLQSGDMATAIARFLTANFLHMSMTALLANALDDFVTDTERYVSDLSRTMLFVIALHGAYDFCLSSRAFGDLSYAAMTIFVLLARQFLVTVADSRGRPPPGRTLLETFAVGTAVVTAASYVYAAILVGPPAAARVLAQGMLGVAILVVVFVRQLEQM